MESFKLIKVDGSENGEPHCLKDCGIAASAIPAIAEATQKETDSNGKISFCLSV